MSRSVLGAIASWAACMALGCLGESAPSLSGDDASTPVDNGAFAPDPDDEAVDPADPPDDPDPFDADDEQAARAARPLEPSRR